MYWLYAMCFGFLTILGLSLLLRRLSVGYRFLGVYFLGEAYVLFTTYLIYGGLMDNYPHFFRTGSPFMYLYGPLSYFFIVSVINPRYRFRVFDLIHLLPFVLHIVELWPFWVLSGTEKVVLYRELLNLGREHIQWGILTYREHAILKSGLVIGYLMAGYVKIRTAFDHFGKLLANWKNQMLLTFLVLNSLFRVGAFMTLFLVYLLSRFLPQGVLYFGDAVFLIDAFLAALFLLLHPGFVSENLLNREAGAYPSDSTSGDEKSAETAKKINLSDSFEEDLNKIFEEYYSDPGLNIGILSTLMNLSERQLFRKTKELMGNSPVELLLSFRLEKAHEAIRSQPEKSIGQILIESGFNNRSYFSKRFQQHFGVSPRDLRKSVPMSKPENGTD
jgi:AraC-like DNA-binding protein